MACSDSRLQVGDIHAKLAEYSRHAGYKSGSVCAVDGQNVALVWLAFRNLIVFNRVALHQQTVRFLERRKRLRQRLSTQSARRQDDQNHGKLPAEPGHGGVFYVATGLGQFLRNRRDHAGPVVADSVDDNHAIKDSKFARSLTGGAGEFMILVLQRCTGASVFVENRIVGAIEKGLTVFVGIVAGDDLETVAKMAKKAIIVRIFDDEDGRFQYSVADVNGAVLAIPNFTLAGEMKKGTRPNFGKAAPPEEARELFEAFVKMVGDSGVRTASGVFGAQMRVSVENDGPVTLILES